jgi:acyl carrier protein
MTDFLPGEQEMLSYLKEKVLGNRRPDITVDTPLVSSGLVDSFTLIDLLLRLEKATGRRISPGKVNPRDMETVRLMVATAERVGTPRA